MQSFRPQGMGVLPTAVKWILIINVVLFLVTQLLQQSGVNIEEYLAIYYPASRYFIITQFVTHLFMHGSFMHLISNMFALFIFGAVLENVWGSKRFVQFYFYCGIGAAIVHLGMQWWEFSQLKNAIDQLGDAPTYDIFIRFYNKHIANKGFSYEYMSLIDNVKDSWANNMNDTTPYARLAPAINMMYEMQMNVPTVGASGAVFGMLMAFGMMFPNTMIYIYFLFPIKAKYIVFLYGAFELYNAMQYNPADNVAHFAHLGGMLFGFVIVTIWNRTQRNKLF